MERLMYALMVLLLVLAGFFLIMSIRGFRRRRILRVPQLSAPSRPQVLQRRNTGRGRRILLLFLLVLAVIGVQAAISSGSFLAFPIALVDLMLCYMAAIILLLFLWRVIARLVNRQAVNPGALLQEILQLFVEKPVTIRRPTRNGDHEVVQINLANNHRWYALVAMMISSYILAWMFQGEGLFWSTVRGVFGSIMGEENAQHLGYFLFTGWFTPSTPAEAFKYQSRPPAGLIENWFFLKAALIYTILVVVYFFFAFWDELMHLIGEVREMIERRRAEVQRKREEEYRRQQAAVAQAQRAQGRRGRQQQAAPVPTPAPSGRVSFGELLEVEFIGELLTKILFGFFEMFHRHHQGIPVVR